MKVFIDFVTSFIFFVGLYVIAIVLLGIVIWVISKAKEFIKGFKKACDFLDYKKTNKKQIYILPDAEFNGITFNRLKNYLQFQGLRDVDITRETTPSQETIITIKFRTEELT